MTGFGEAFAGDAPLFVEQPASTLDTDTSATVPAAFQASFSSDWQLGDSAAAVADNTAEATSIAAAFTEAAGTTETTASEPGFAAFSDSFGAEFTLTPADTLTAPQPAPLHDAVTVGAADVAAPGDGVSEPVVADAVGGFGTEFTFTSSEMPPVVASAADTTSTSTTTAETTADAPPVDSSAEHRPQHAFDTQSFAVNAVPLEPHAGFDSQDTFTPSFGDNGDGADHIHSADGAVATDAHAAAAAAAATAEALVSETDTAVTDAPTQDSKHAAFDSAFSEQGSDPIVAPDSFLLVGSDALLVEDTPAHQHGDSVEAVPAAAAAGAAAVSVPEPAEGASDTIVSPTATDGETLPAWPHIISEIATHAAHEHQVEQQSSSLAEQVQALRKQLAAQARTEQSLRAQVSAFESAQLQHAIDLRRAQETAATAAAEVKAYRAEAETARVALQKERGEHALREKDLQADLEHWRQEYTRLQVYADDLYDQLVYMEQMQDELRRTGVLIPVDVTRGKPQRHQPKPREQHVTPPATPHKH